MTGVLALDLSKTRTGWALWQPGWERPKYGGWKLGSEFTSDGGVFAALHVRMSELRQVAGFTTIYYERPINPANLGGHTNIHTLELAAGLAAHVLSFAEAKRCLAYAINIATWRKDFVGPGFVNDAQAKARALRKAGSNKASARPELKALTIARCRQLGFSPKTDDEADALGILDFALDFHEHVRPPWRADEVFRPMLGGVAV